MNKCVLHVQRMHLLQWADTTQNVFHTLKILNNGMVFSGIVVPLT